MVPRGLSAFETYIGLYTHFLTPTYDGWKYGFKTKFAENKFKADKQVQYAYAAIERDYPTKNDQIRFMYPALKLKGARMKPLDIMLMRKQHKLMTQWFDTLPNVFVELLDLLKTKITSIDQLYACPETLPTIYQLYDRNVFTHDQIVLLFMIFPDLNNVVSNEPFVYDKWQSKIQFDKRFFSLYISAPVLLLMRKIATDKFKNK